MEGEYVYVIQQNSRVRKAHKVRAAVVIVSDIKKANK